MLEVGKAYLVHTHLGIWLGKIVQLTMDEIVLDTCAPGTRTPKSNTSVTGLWCRATERSKVPWRHTLPTSDK